jgi:hypothetical protein
MSHPANRSLTARSFARQACRGSGLPRGAPDWIRTNDLRIRRSSLEGSFGCVARHETFANTAQTEPDLLTRGHCSGHENPRSQTQGAEACGSGALRVLSPRRGFRRTNIRARDAPLAWEAVLAFAGRPGLADPVKEKRVGARAVQNRSVQSHGKEGVAVASVSQQCDRRAAHRIERASWVGGWRP